MTTPRRLRRGVFRFLVALAVLAVVGGLAVAYLGYRETAGPDGAVKGYFAALRRGDAPSALAFGNLPAGPHTLLTSQVLDEQRALGPIEKVKIRHTDRHGNGATVSVDYTIAFPGRPDPINDKVDVVKQGSSWRLVASAIRTRLDVTGASDRATVLGGALPDGEMLVFPGAAPVRLDSPYLELDAPSAVVTFASTPDTSINVVVTPRGEREAKDAVVAALRRCVTAGADPRCPLPNGRAVPGTMRGQLPADAAKALSVSVGTDPVGQIEVRGTLRIQGSYSLLDFDNVASVQRGRLTVTVRAKAIAVSPLVVSWWRDDTG